jgi:hypothetical protein
MPPASIYVEVLNRSKDEPERVTLNVRYADKEARIELPVPAPLFEREPGVEAYRRELLALIEALGEWEGSRGEIAWHQRP